MLKSIRARAWLSVESLERRDTPSGSPFHFPLTGPPVLPPAHSAPAPILPLPGSNGGLLGTPTGGLPTGGKGAGPIAGPPGAPVTPVGAPVINKDGSKTQTFSDGSKTQTFPTGKDSFGNPTSDVRHQDADGTVTETTTGSDKNGNPQTTTITKRPGPHGTVTRVTVTTDKCTGKVTTVTEIWKWFNDPEGHWEHRLGNTDFTGVHSDPPPQPTAPK